MYQPQGRLCGCKKKAVFTTEVPEALYIYMENDVRYVGHFIYNFVIVQECLDKTLLLQPQEMSLSVLIKCRNPTPSGCQFANKILIRICQKSYVITIVGGNCQQLLSSFCLQQTDYFNHKHGCKE